MCEIMVDIDMTKTLSFLCLTVLNFPSEILINLQKTNAAEFETTTCQESARDTTIGKDIKKHISITVSEITQ